MRHFRRSERGAALVEGAFAIPIFFVMVLGLVDFGMLAFESNRASNAARDGARIGIIDYIDADQDSPPSANYLAIKSEIESKLQGQTIDLEVNCLTPGGLDIPCTEAVVDVDVDRISVKVSWDRKAISPIGRTLGIGSVEVDGESRMTIVGRPIGGPASPPPACNITDVSVSPDPVTTALVGVGLATDLHVTVTGTGACSNHTVNLIAPGGAGQTQICSSGCVVDDAGNPKTTTYPAGTGSFWTPGTASAVVRTSGGSDQRSRNFEVEAPVVPAVCEVTDVVVTPDPVQRVVGGANNGQLTQGLSVDVVGSGVCTNLTLALHAPGGPSAVICGPGNCLGTTAYSAVADSFWTAGPAEARITGEETFTGTFTVTDQPPCAVEIAIQENPAEAKNGQLKNVGANVRQRVTVSQASSSGPCPDLVVTMTPPSGSGTVTLCNTGPCLGEFVYADTAAIWAPPDGAGSASATVDVVGADFAASATFVVQRK